MYKHIYAIIKQLKKMKKRFIIKIYLFGLLTIMALGFSASYASDLETQLYQTGLPYIKYFSDQALGAASGFDGLTRSFQLYLGSGDPADEAMINNGAIAYDQSILARISLAGGQSAILDTYLYYSTRLSDPNNPLFNCNGNYYGAGGPSDPILNGPYRVVRILGRDLPNWWSAWDWVVDTGAAACLIIDSLEAYQKTLNPGYLNLATLLGNYILKLQDSDGGIRYGPRGMYHITGNDFYWNLKSTEQNERCLYAFDALYSVAAQPQYSNASAQIKTWLKNMYDKTVHLYHSAAIFNGGAWVAEDFGYVATDVAAFAPLDLMFSNAYFGNTQAERDAEVDAMFEAIESRTAFIGSLGKPVFFRFSLSQATDDYGSLEWSAQMALAYLRAAQNYSSRGNNASAQAYLDKYYTLVSSLEGYFSVPSGSPDAKVAPYASYLNGSVAGGVPTGTGYDTFNCQAAIASAYYAFAKAGYDPINLGGGSGIPQIGSVLNLSAVTWYQNAPPYNSTAAATCQMILNYLREGAGVSLLAQNQVFEYARLTGPLSGELNPDEVDRALGHFDPYDSIVSNWADNFDSIPDGNPYQGYNYTIDTYDPALNTNAFNDYARDICHWMAYTATKEEWWKNGELTARPNTPAAVPAYGTYNRWLMVKGYAASANPCPQPRTNPWYTPPFTVYGFWIKDPSVNGIGKDTYVTADECRQNYFLPLSTYDAYNGKFVQVAEPPVIKSKAHIHIGKVRADFSNLRFIGAESNLSPGLKKARAAVKKAGWQDIVELHLLSDTQAVAAFSGSRAGRPFLVSRPDNNLDYYLVPFNKQDKKGRVLTQAVVILDAKDGHFKEASWTDKPEVFLKVHKQMAVELVRRYILANARNQRLSAGFIKLRNYVTGAGAQLIWEPNSYSSSPYKPYWRVDANGYIFYVTENKKVIPEASLSAMLQEINNNIIYLRNSKI